jgi:PTS system nitrogen regulatory IIA component
MQRLSRIAGLFVKLQTAIDFEAPDDIPVDLVFLLLTPAEAGADHLKALARISRLLRHAGTCERLRAATSADALYALLTEPPAGSRAA